MTKRTAAIVALIAATIFLFVNRSTFNLERVVIPIFAVAFLIWVSVRLGWLQAAINKLKTIKIKDPEKEFKKVKWEGVGYQSSSQQANPSQGYSFHQQAANTSSQTQDKAKTSNEQPSAKRASQAKHSAGGDEPLVYTISVSKETKWSAELAIALIRELALKMPDLIFRIAAENGQIKWQIVDPQADPKIADQISKTVRSAYIDATVSDPQSYWKGKVEKPYYRGIQFFGQIADFALPIKQAKEISRADPLAVIANILSTIDQDETASYLVYIGEPDYQLHEEAHKLVTLGWTGRDTGIAIALLLSFAGWVVLPFWAGYKASKWNRREPKYKDRDMTQLYAKIHDLPFTRCCIAVEINTPTRARLEQFNFIPAMLQFSEVPQKIVPLNEPIVSHITSEELDRAHSVITQIDAISAKWTAKPKKRDWGKQLTEGKFAIFCPSEVAALWHLPHEEFTSTQIAWQTGRHVPMPVALRGKTEGVLIGENEIQGGKTLPVYVSRKDRTTHQIVLGKPNMGKSTFIHNEVHVDIAEGYGVCVIDPSPQGKLVRDILQRSIPPEREQDVFLWDLRDTDNPPPFNILLAQSNVAKRDAAASIQSVFQKVYGDDFGYSRMGYTLSMALQTLMGDEQPTLRDAGKLYDPKHIKYREKLLRNLDDDLLYEYWEDWDSLSKGEKGQRKDPIVRKLQELYKNPTLYPIICHPDPMTIGDIIREKRIFLMCLGVPKQSRLAPNEQALLGATVVSQIQLAMTEEEREDPFYLYVDEARHFVTSALPDIFAEARKQNLCLTLANQYLGQLAGDTLKAVMETVGAMVVYQIGEGDAGKLDGYFTPEFSRHDLMNMEVHNAALRMYYDEQQQRPFTITPNEPLPKPDDADEREARIRALSRARYTPRSRKEVLEWLQARYPKRRDEDDTKPRPPSEGMDDDFSDPEVS